MPTTSKLAVWGRAWRLRAVTTFSENWSPIQGLFEFMRSTEAGHSPPKSRRGCVPSAVPKSICDLVFPVCFGAP